MRSTPSLRSVPNVAFETAGQHTVLKDTQQTMKCCRNILISVPDTSCDFDVNVLVLVAQWLERRTRD